MTQSSERMSRVDTAWLRMDSRVNLMMIVGVWLLRPALDAAALRERLESRLLRYARFRQKVVQEAVFSYWVADDDFDIERHLAVVGRRRRRRQHRLVRRRRPVRPDHRSPALRRPAADHRALRARVREAAAAAVADAALGGNECVVSCVMSREACEALLREALAKPVRRQPTRARRSSATITVPRGTAPRG